MDMAKVCKRRLSKTVDKNLNQQQLKEILHVLGPTFLPLEMYPKEIFPQKDKYSNAHYSNV